MISARARGRAALLCFAPALIAACTAAGPTPAAPPSTSAPPPPVAAASSSSPVASAASKAPAASASPSATPSPPASAPAAASVSARPPAELAPRPVLVKAACTGAKLSYAAVASACGCELRERAQLTGAKEPLCDFIKSDEQAVQGSLRAELVADPGAVPPGGKVQLTARYVNAGREPLHVRLEREQHGEIEVLDQDDKPLPLERDPRCHEVGMLSMAEFALVVLPPGGTLEVSLPFVARKTRRVPDGDLGCRSAPGSPLPRGSYKLRAVGHHVWDLRDRPLVTELTVR